MTDKTEIRRVVVPPEALYAAFTKGKADGRYEIDEIRFNEFQRGWNEAMDFINADTIGVYGP